MKFRSRWNPLRDIFTLQFYMYIFSTCLKCKISSQIPTYDRVPFLKIAHMPKIVISQQFPYGIILPNKIYTSAAESQLLLQMLV